MADNSTDSSEQIKRELSARIDAIKQQLSDLEIVVTGQKKIWYKDASTIIAVLALMFSFGTTLVSLQRSAAQDLESRRQDLRGLLQRLAALPKENLDASVRYAADPNSRTFYGGLINQETTLLSQQAGELAKRLPKESVSSVEYYSVAMAMQNTYNFAGAKEFLKLSMDSARNFNEEIGAVRSSANLEYIEGHPQAGRVLYQQALNIFAKYSGYDSYTIANTHITTELFWANSEAGLGSRDLVAQHVQNAENILSALAPSPGKAFLASQISAEIQQLQTGAAIPVPVGAVPQMTPVAAAKP